MLKMQKIVLTLMFALLGISTYCQDTIYPYFRIASISVRHSAFDSVEFREAENEQFKVTYKGYGSFDTNCILRKFTSVFFYYNSGISQLSGADSFVFVHNKPVERLQFSNNRFRNRSTFLTSADAQIDTIVTQHYNNLYQLVNMTRTILYRNRQGKDSLFKQENFQNGAWQLGQEYHEFFYDNTGRLIQRKLGGYYLINTIRFYCRNQTTNYIYSGNFLVTQIDSFAETLGDPINTHIALINKWDYKYDALGRLSEGIYSKSNTLPNLDTTFSPNIRHRYTLYNSENKNIVYYTDSWKANAWIETNMNSTKYTDNNLSQSSFQYAKNGSIWWLSLKSYKNFCGVSMPPQEVSFDLALKIYPNPTQNTVILESEVNSTSENTLHVFDYAGHLVLQQKEMIFPYVIDMSKQTNGLYFFKITNEKGQSTTRKVLIMK